MGTCDHEKPYLAIIITILPSWALLTLLISVVIGRSSDLYSTSELLTYIDQVVLVYSFSSFVLFMSTFNLLEKSFKDSGIATFKGLLVGLVCFAITLTFGIILRCIIRRYYSLKLGTGSSAIIYYVYNALMISSASSLWIYATFIAYKKICSQDYSRWLLTICVAIVEGIVLSILCSVIAWIIQLPRYTEQQQNIFPDDTYTGPQDIMLSKSISYKTVAGKQSPPGMMNSVPIQQQGSWPGAGPGMQLQYYPPPGYHPLYTVVPQTDFKSYPHSYQIDAQMPAVPYYTSQPSPTQIQQQVPPAPTGPKLRKMKSNESTGSNYYKQVMKNKGGVTSISQYGLLKPKKRDKG